MSHLECVRDVLIVVLAGVALLWRPAPDEGRDLGAAPPRINGAYTLTFAGPGVGEGRAIVNPGRVRINGTMTDAQGNQMDFSASLDLDPSTYRFRGTGTLGGASANVIGRLDPDDRTLRKCRLTATFVATDGRAGRIVGAHN